MPMTANGLAKLHEEIGELLQETGKKLAYFYAAEHPDGAGPLDERMRREMADVYAALDFACAEFGLSPTDVAERRDAKLALFLASSRLPMTAGGIVMLHHKMGALLVATTGLLDGFAMSSPDAGRPDAEVDRVVQAVADLYAALDYVRSTLSLHEEWIESRRATKLALFNRWHADNANGAESYHAVRSGAAVI